MGHPIESDSGTCTREPVHPAIRLEVRLGGGKPAEYEVADAGFLIGTVPGCDLRLPGSNLPPVLCMVIRNAVGADLRGLAPVYPLTLNGQPVTTTQLTDGDRIGLGNHDILVRLLRGSSNPTPSRGATQDPRPAGELAAERRELDALRMSLASRALEIEQSEREYRKQSEICDVLQQRLQLQERETAERRADLDRRELVLRETERTQRQAHTEIRVRADQLQRQKDELSVMGRQLADIRQQLHDRYQGEKDRLAKLQAAIRMGAGKLRERKKELEDQTRDLHRRQNAMLQREQEVATAEQELAQRSLALSEREEQLTQEQADLGAARAAIDTSREELEARHRARRHRLVGWRQVLRRGAQKLRKAKAKLEENQRQCTERMLDDTKELEDQARQLEEWRTALQAEAAKNAEVRKQQESLHDQLQQHIAALEGQQGVLAALRTKLERGREELHAEEQQLNDQRAALQAREQELQERLAAFQRNQGELATEKQAFESERQGFQERVRLMAAALEQMKQKQVELQEREAELQRQATQRLEETPTQEGPGQISKANAESMPVAQPAAPPAEATQPAAHAPESDGHLAELRQWYKQRLRVLAAGREDKSSGGPAAAATSGRNILTLTGSASAADRQLGEVLRSLDLVDAETLYTLLVQARKLRRSLRHVLLSGGSLTLYQIALIEAGNLEALMLGPLRVIDRLRSNALETIYRVHDPRQKNNAILRHLSEEAAGDTARAEEFRRRFGQACQVHHPHLATALEVLEILGRPAVLLEPLSGVCAPDWPELAGVPGVWYRLVSQAVLGLKCAHESQLFHGHLENGMILLTEDGTVKLCGFGEPGWLAGEETTHAASEQEDLKAMGLLVAQWLSPTQQRKAGKSRKLPAPLQQFLRRLQAEEQDAGFRSAADLLEELERVGEDISSNAAAWDRLLHHVREHAVELTPLRKSA